MGPNMGEGYMTVLIFSCFCVLEAVSHCGRWPCSVMQPVLGFPFRDVCLPYPTG